MKSDNNVPIPVLRRMPSYLSFVKTLQKQVHPAEPQKVLQDFHKTIHLISNPRFSGNTRMGQIFGNLGRINFHIFGNAGRRHILFRFLRVCFVAG